MKGVMVVLFTLMCTLTYGQTKQQQAHDLGMKAIKEMEAGNIDESIELLEEAGKLDPKNIDYPYEIAYANYLGKQYDKASKILKRLTKHEDANERIWQMLGNSYDLNGNKEKAIETYEKGLELFPNSGILHLERGNVFLFEEEYNTALGYYEKGILVDPEFSSNYYWASKLYLNSAEEVWGMIYGEIFMNLERNTRRTAEISQLLYATYNSEITAPTDTTMSVSFCEQMSININDLDAEEPLTLPFCMVYEPTLLMSAIFSKTMNLPTLNQVRTSFVKNYYKMEHHLSHPNALFEYQKQLMELGHLEAYNYWILMKGDEKAFTQWQNENGDKWESFAAWFSTNSIVINEEQFFHRTQY